MPLSDHEQRVLEQIEQALYDEDPKFARLYQATDIRTHYRARLSWSVAGFIIGIGLLLTAVILPLIALGVVGFVVMLASALYGIHSWQRMIGRKSAVTTDELRPRRRAARRDRGRSGEDKRSVVQRLEERWQRRQDEGR